ncbi:SulP family inorganic anion transporter [Halanaerobaculum tunisiense]
MITISQLSEKLANINLQDVKDDLRAGLSVAALALPQNMAYALIIGISPIYGLYTSIVSMLIGSIVGASNYMIVGPTNLMAMAIASNLSFVAEENYLSAILLLTCLVGIFQFLFGMLRLGNLVNYISHSVIVGLTSGTALIIAVGQVENLLELAEVRGINLFLKFYSIINQLETANLWALVLGITTIISILLFKRINDKLPSYLLGIIIPTIVVYFLNLESQVEIVGSLPSAIPTFNLFDLNMELGLDLWSKALSVAIIGLIQTLAIVKSLEDRSEEEVDVNQEFIGQGIINFISSFFNCFASAGSFTNSFVNYQVGAKSRLAEFFTALAIMLFMFVFDKVVFYVPIASLAGLIMLAAYQMFDIQEIIRVFHTTRSDAVIFVVTCLAVITLPSLEYAIYLGVSISLLIVLRESSKVNLYPMDYSDQADNKLAEKELEEVDQDNNYLVVNVAGNLHFNAADNLKDELDEIYKEEQTFIIRMRDIEKIDLTAIKELDKFIVKVQNNDGDVLLSGLGSDVYNSLDNFGIVSKIGKKNIFHSQSEILSSTIEAVETAEDDKESN